MSAQIRNLRVASTDTSTWAHSTASPIGRTQRTSVFLFHPSEIGVFKCEETEGACRGLVAVLTESAWLLLEPSAKDGNVGTLLVWATLHALARVERNTNTPNNLSFFWLKPDKSVSLLSSLQLVRKLLNKRFTSSRRPRQSAWPRYGDGWRR